MTHIPSSACRGFLASLLLCNLAVMTANASLFYDLSQKGDAETDRGAQVDIFTRALAAWAPPDYPDDKAAVLVRRGHAYNDIGRRDAALADMDAALALTPNSSTAYRGKAAVLADMNRCSEAVTAGDAAVRFADEQNRPSTYYDLGLSYEQCSKNYDAAALQFENAIVGAKKIGDSRNGNRSILRLAATRCKQHKHKEALQLFGIAVPLLDSPNAYYELGVCNQARGAYAAAEKAYTKALRIGGNTNKRAAATGKRTSGNVLTTSTSSSELLGETYYRRGQVREKMDDVDPEASSHDYTQACNAGYKPACAK